MKKSIALAVFAVIYSIFAGCTDKKNTGEQKAEVARATFISEKGETITAVYYADESVQLQLPDQTKAELFLAVSGSGSRYTNDASEWWEHQGEATYEVDGKSHFHGKMEPRE